MDKEYGGLETLQVWQAAMSFVETIYREVIPHLPSNERFALRDQLQRAVQSIPANLAEGYGRYHFADRIRFCYIARGSVEEVFTFLEIARRLNYISEDNHRRVQQELQRVKQMINGYIRYLRGQQHAPHTSPKK